MNVGNLKDDAPPVGVPSSAPAVSSPGSPAALHVAVVIRVEKVELRNLIAKAMVGLADELSRMFGSRYEFRTVISPTQEHAEAELARALGDGPEGAAVLVSDQLSNEPDVGLMANQPKLSGWGERVHSLFPNGLLGTVALTQWERRVPDVDRTVGWSVARSSLVEAIVKTVRTVEYKAPPGKRLLGEPAVVRLVRTEEEMEEYFQLRHFVYSVMGYLPNDVEAAQSGLEIDWCDRNSIPIAAFPTGPGSMLGTARVILTRTVYPQHERWARDLCLADPIIRNRFERPLAMQLPIMQSQDLDGTYVKIMRAGLRCCELSRVIVADEYRGTGLSGALIRFALSIVGRFGIDLVYLECIPGHQSLYEKHGFRRLNVERKRVVDVNKSMIAMALDRSSANRRTAEGDDWPGAIDLFGRSYLCCCRERGCFEGRYDLYGARRCPLVSSHHFHDVLCENINLGRLES